MMPDEASPTKVSRLFFALWPQAAVREQLAQLAGQMADRHEGRCVQPENLHLTLAFIGEVDNSIIPEICEAASVIRRPLFDLLLDTIHFWRRSNVIAAGIKHSPPELMTLEQDLRDRLSVAGVYYDCHADRFVPHVTLVRNAKSYKLSNSIPAIDWRVTQWSLAQSRLTPHGSTYHSLANWALEP